MGAEWWRSTVANPVEACPKGSPVTTYFGYVDYTVDDQVPYYVGIGSLGRTKCLQRNWRHTEVTALHGQSRRIALQSEQRKDVEDWERHTIAQLRTYHYDYPETVASNLTHGGERCSCTFKPLCPCEECKGAGPQSDYVSVATFAARHTVSERSVLTWVKRGLPHDVTGRTLSIPVQKAEKWLVNGGGSKPKRQTRARRTTA